MGRLAKADREACIDSIAHAIVETGETRLIALAEVAGVHRNSVAPLVKAARERIGRETPAPVALRQTFLAQSATVYRKALEGHERAKAHGDERVANEFLRTANEALRTASKLGGIDELKAEAGAQHPSVRITFESWGESAPPAALAAVARLSAAPGPAALSRSSGTLPNYRGGRALGQGHSVLDGADSPGDGGGRGDEPA